MNPFISICIPAYKNKAMLKRLLDSIETQSFRDFEVIVSDDSPDDELEKLVNTYSDKFSLAYYKNQTALGSPANWNQAIKPAKGEWIKLMHHDDWFADENSVKVFADHAKKSKNADFIFSAHQLYENDKLKSVEKINSVIQQHLRKNTLILFSKNYIGHPSTTLIKNNREFWYDEKIKWVVDFEFYIRVLSETDFIYIDETLINIGLGAHQLTSEVFRNRKVEIPENVYLLNKLGTNILKNIIVYDYYWRLLRNLKIRNWSEFENETTEIIPEALQRMFDVQKKYSLKILNNGFVSKLLMSTTYLKEKRK